MINFFGTNNVVPNGYIYTSHKGSEYICLEGIWFNHSNMQLVDPKKTTMMNEAAIKQINQYNSTGKRFIGESTTFIGRKYVYLGNNRYSEDGKVLAEATALSEVISDDQRVYDVSKDTLDKEWNELKFYILPPYVEDITIPAGLVVNGYRFIPRSNRFVNEKDGSVADNVLMKKLWAEGIRIARRLRHEAGNDILPVNSTIMLRNQNKRAEWNGTDFRDNDGNVVVPSDKANQVKSMYSRFIKSNAEDFPSITGVQQRETVTEADDKSVSEVPNGYMITSRAGTNYYKKNGQWISQQTKKPMNSSAAKSIERAALTKIAEFNKTSPIKIGDTWTSDKGKEYMYVGDDRLISSEGKMVPKNSVQKILQKMTATDEQEPESTDTSTEEPEVQQEPSKPVQQEPAKQEEPTQDEPSSDESGGSELEQLANQIKKHPQSRKIQVLLTRGDKVSLMAADILLDGSKDKVIEILKTLNSTDE